MTGCAASAIATHTPNPTGAPGSAPCQPAPVPRANAITTTPPSASSLAAVTTFCTHRPDATPTRLMPVRSEEHTSELQSRFDLVCRLLLEKKKNNTNTSTKIATPSALVLLPYTRH